MKWISKFRRLLSGCQHGRMGPVKSEYVADGTDGGYAVRWYLDRQKCEDCGAEFTMSRSVRTTGGNG